LQEGLGSLGLHAQVRLGAASSGHVMGQHHHRCTAAEVDAVRRHLDLDLAAVLQAVAPRARLALAGRPVLQVRHQPGHVGRPADLLDAHGQEFRALYPYLVTAASFTSRKARLARSKTHIGCGLDANSSR
jgi:hypothetical protein